MTRFLPVAAVLAFALAAANPAAAQQGVTCPLPSDDPTQPGSDFVSGGDGGDFLVGNFGNDLLLGGAGDDQLMGDAFFDDPGGIDFCLGQQGFDLTAGCEFESQTEGPLTL